MSLDNFERCCGPESDMKYQIPETPFIKRVDNIAFAYSKGGWDMPPLIILHEEKGYELSDGNHRYEALKKLEIHKYCVIIWETIVS